MLQRRPPIWLIVVLASVVALIVACGSGGVAVRKGVINPPEINLTIRGIGMVAHTTNVPSCALWFTPCRVTALGPAREMYAIWVVWRPVQNRGERPGARRIFAMLIDP